MTWYEQARCRTLALPTSGFYPTSGESPTGAVVAACEGCPVREQCLDHALRHELYGYWAGTSARQRWRLRGELGVAYVALYDDQKTGEPRHGTQRAWRRHGALGEDACFACEEWHARDLRRRQLARARRAEAAS